MKQWTVCVADREQQRICALFNLPDMSNHEITNQYSVLVIVRPSTKNIQIVKH